VAVEREWPLVGRAAELTRVGEVLRAGAGGVVLAGPAGVGKTRLAGECLGLAEGRGFVPLRVTATQAASSLPFGAFAPFVPELAGGMDRADVLRQVAGSVIARGEGKPVALLVDDAHLLDEGSAALTHQLAAGPDGLVLATVRSGEPASDAVMALWKDGLAERIELSPFSLAEVEDLLAPVLGGPVDGPTVRLLWERTELEGRSDEAERHLAGLVADAVDDSQRAMLACLRMDILAMALGRMTDALRVGEEAEAAIADRFWRDDVTVKHAGVLSEAGRTKQALDLLEPLLARAQGRTLVVAYIHGAITLALAGRLSAALEVSGRGRAAHLALAGPPLPIGPYIHSYLRCCALTFAGRLDEAEEIGTGEYQRAIAAGSVEGQAASCYLARTLLAQGRVAGAARLARESAGLFRQLQWSPAVRIALIPLAHALALAGKARDARAALEDLDRLGLPATDVFAAELLQARAWAEVTRRPRRSKDPPRAGSGPGPRERRFGLRVGRAPRLGPSRPRQGGGWRPPRVDPRG
jgi:hypothetical protein